MVRHRRTVREVWSDSALGVYVLIVRGPDGQPHQERFTNAAAYQARLVALGTSNEASLSIQEIAELLDEN